MRAMTRECICGYHVLVQACCLWVLLLTAQKITFDEFLPAILGHKLDPYPGYDDVVDPRVSVEFATSGYRMGHSMVAADIDFFDDNANPLFPVRRVASFLSILRLWPPLLPHGFPPAQSPVQGMVVDRVLSLFNQPVSLLLCTSPCFLRTTSSTRRSCCSETASSPWQSE